LTNIELQIARANEEVALRLVDDVAAVKRQLQSRITSLEGAIRQQVGIRMSIEEANPTSESDDEVRPTRSLPPSCRLFFAFMFCSMPSLSRELCWAEGGF
jgi:hypothetical protein